MAGGKLGSRRPLLPMPRPVRLPVETTPVAPPNEQVEGAEERVEAHRQRVEREEPEEPEEPEGE